VVIGDAISNNILPPIGKEKSAIGIELADIVRACWLEYSERPTLMALEQQLINIESRYFPASSGKQQAGEVLASEY